MDRRPARGTRPSTRPSGLKRPNYTLRRIVALAVLLVAILLVSRIVTGIAALFRSDGGRTAVAKSSGSPTAPASPASVTPPACSVGKRPAAFDGYDEWQLTLLDTRYRLSRSYVPPGLQPISKAGFTGALLVRDIVVQDLAALRRAAAAAGAPIGIVAGYRSYDDQASLFARRQRQLGKAEAAAKTARPGHSEHQLGTSIDFKSAGQRDVTENWDRTRAGRWVSENAWRFGFIQSYPRGLEGVTCYANEPWHYRYFGRTLAAEVHASGLTVREFLWKEQDASASPIP